MGHIADPAGAVVVGCKVLPIFNEHGTFDGAMKKIVHRIDGRKAVARVKELLKRAAQARPHSTTVGGKKWKKVLSFQARDGAATKCSEQQPSDDMSSKLSFKWDVGSCSSASSVLYSPLSFVSAPAKTTVEHTPSRTYVSRLSSMSQQSSSVLEPIAGLLYSPKNEQDMEEQQQQEEAACRMGQWITTDSDFVVLEL